MAVPTLLVEGALRSPGGFPETTPAEFIVEWVRRHVPELGAPPRPPAHARERVLLVRAATGSGKSTVLPAMIFKLFRGEHAPPRIIYTGPNVLCTQPRVLTAISLARDLSQSPHYPDLALGHTVGYQTGPVKERPARGLIFATAGTLLAQLRVHAPDALKRLYRVIIVDEAHERSTDLDTLVALLKMFIHDNIADPQLPVIIFASATLDVKKFAGFFDLPAANVVEVEGRGYPIRTHWPAESCVDYIREIVRVALQIHAARDDPPGRGDIMAFVPGKGEMLGVARLLRAEQARGGRPFVLLQLDGPAVQRETRDYQLIHAPPGALADARRIIVATNVAETGLTIRTLKYVIDTGWGRQPERYPSHNAMGLVTRPVAQSRIHQRMGRVARLFPGEFFPLYPRSVFGRLRRIQLPDVVTSDTTRMLLDLAARAPPDREFRIEELDLLDPIPSASLLRNLENLLFLGFMSSAGGPGGGYGVTPLGRIAARFSRTPLAAVRLLLAGPAWGAAQTDLATMAAVFDRPPLELGKKGRPPAPEAYTAIPNFLKQRSAAGETPLDGPARALWRLRLLTACDFVETIVLFESFRAALDDGGMERAHEWCDAVGLNYDALVMLQRRRETIFEESLMAGLEPFHGGDWCLLHRSASTFMVQVRALKRCLHDALAANRLVYDGRAGHYTTRQGRAVPVPGIFGARASDDLRGLGVVSARPPAVLLTDQLRLVAVRRAKTQIPPLLYAVQATNATALDGFVATDPSWYLPRPAKSRRA